jgi:membrane-associated protease RseP (regulator of RpoE activity)
VFSLEPQHTPFDLHFQVAGIPVRIHPGFWIAGFILGFNASSNGTRPLPVLIWIGVTFVSILVHEMGHALCMRRFGFRPRIVLYHMGGLAIRDQGFLGFESRSRNDTRESILISLAGPGAGFVLAGLTVLMVFLAGGFVKTDFTSWTQPWYFEVPGVRPPSPVVQGGPWWYVIEFSLFVNIFWGLVNLLPVFPLDGGQVARELFMARDRYRGMTYTLQLSIGVGIVVAAFFLVVVQDKFVAIMFALLAVNSYLMLQQLGRFS